MAQAKEKRIFITGATGFLGSYILRHLLKQGYTNITASHRSGSSFNMCWDFRDQVKWVEGNLDDYEFLKANVEGSDWVFHAAALVSFSRKDKAKLIKTNEVGTRHLINAALYSDLEKFCHISSIAAIGTPWHKEIYDEEDVLSIAGNTSLYAITKFRGEQEVWRGVAEGINAVILNPSLILGAGRWNEGSMQLFSKVASGMKFYPTATKGVVDVRDVATAAVKLMESNISGERFILNAENLSLKKLLDRIAHHLKVSKPKRELSPTVVTFLKILGTCLKPLGLQGPLDPDLLDAAIESTKYSGEKIKQAINFEYRRLENTLKETVVAFEKGDNPISFLK